MVASTLRVGASLQLGLRQIKSLKVRQAKTAMDLAMPINMAVKESRHFNRPAHLGKHPRKSIYNPMTSRRTQVTNLGVQNITLHSYSSPEPLFDTVFFQYESSIFSSMS